MNLQLNERSPGYAEALADQQAIVSETVIETLLIPGLIRAESTAVNRQMVLLDMSPKPDPVVELVCTGSGVKYLVPQDEQSPPEAQPDGVTEARVDVTYSLALLTADGVTQSRDAARIANQLESTRPGGASIFARLDWRNAAATRQSAAYPAFEQVCTFILSAGVKGAEIGAAVQHVASEQSGQYTVDKTRITLPGGDYRALLLATAEGVYQQQMGQRDGRLLEAGVMLRCIDTIRQADDLVVSPPAVVAAVALVN